MGQPKLLLPWGRDPVIASVLRALARDEIAERFVVIRPDDTALQQAVHDLPAVALVPPVDPPTMRDSVELALAAIEEQFSPTERDGWMLIPADHPIVRPGVLNAMLDAWRNSSTSILVPVYPAEDQSRRRGHPTIFRWSLVSRIRSLPADCGLNRLLQDSPQDVAELPVDDESILWDLDTPEDYDRLISIAPI